MYKSYFKEHKKYKFNTKTTGMSRYDDIMKNPEYHQYYKGMVYKIVQMHPLDFMGKLKNKSSSDPYQLVDQKLVDKYADQISRGAKFDMPVLEIDEDGWINHEGRHRVLAMNQLGVTKIDVMIVNHIEKDIDKWFEIGMKKLK